jgi:DNA repair ATPase RecN
MPMSLKDTLSTATEMLKTESIAHALIGGFALAAYGVARATQDIDLLVDGSDHQKVKQLMMTAGFKVVHESNEVLQLSGIGQLDLLFANREATQKMLATAKVFNQFPVPVVALEDLIALKIQAYVNDPKREFQDKADILALLQNNPNANYDIIKKYADLFEQWSAIEDIKTKL